MITNANAQPSGYPGKNERDCEVLPGKHKERPNCSDVKEE
jgi:hypothetical protein